MGKKYNNLLLLETQIADINQKQKLIYTFRNKNEKGYFYE
jgi:hypothetical protein